MALESTLDDLLAEVGESLDLIQADPAAAFERLIAKQRRLIAHLQESAPIENVEAALGVNGVVWGSGFLTRGEMDKRADALMRS